MAALVAAGGIASADEPRLLHLLPLAQPIMSPAAAGAMQTTARQNRLPVRGSHSLAGSNRRVGQPTRRSIYPFTPRFPQRVGSRSSALESGPGSMTGVPPEWFILHATRRDLDHRASR